MHCAGPTGLPHLTEGAEPTSWSRRDHAQNVEFYISYWVAVVKIQVEMLKVSYTMDLLDIDLTGLY